MRFTKEQESAILAENREVLVSAAAGSGKTAVLVERILHLIRDKGYSIDRMLIVTYTRAAAAELRERLETRIQEAALEDPRLSRQADLVGQAQISTIHSYCQRVIREQFRFCQIDPQFSMGDERTMHALYQDSMDEALDSFYTLAKEDGDVRALTKKLPEKNLAAIADNLYRFLMSRPQPLEWLKAQTEKTWSMETIDSEPASQAFLQEARLILEGALETWGASKALLGNPAMPRELEKTIDGDLATLDMLTQAAGEDITALAAALGQCRFVTIARTKPVTSDEVAVVEAYKDMRAGYKKTIQEIRDLLPKNLEAAVQDMNRMLPSMRGLYRLMELLMEAYDRRKRDAAILDFDDLEHMTLAVLGDQDLREAESRRFDAIFVDEYQDVSAIQEAILSGLKREPGEGLKQLVFYVGDVKQSIYRFRLAEPRLFLSKMETFSSQEDAERRKIILNKNFRSRVTVLDGVNRTFAHVMNRRVTEIDYDRSAMLYPGVPSKGDPPLELHICAGEELRQKDVPVREAELIARDILATIGQPVLDGEGNLAGVLRYRDIAILMPTVKGIADQVEGVLTQAGIPVYVDAAVNALGGDEVIQTVQHLTLLDNPMNDTALLAELRSPLFEMSETELCSIRLEKPEKEASFLEALTYAAASAKDPALGRRCQGVLTLLEEERFLYHGMSVSEYLWSFLSRSGLYAYYGAQPGGKLRQANLRMLCQKAEEYAQAHREGLQGFLESIKEKSGGDSSSLTVISPWEDVVRIMTIHKSKGLEFPTVYVMGMGTSISRRRQTRVLAMHGELGLGLQYMNDQARTKRDTFLQSAICLGLSAEERAERARLLYVAMTRAKSRLVMIGSHKTKKRGLESTSEIGALNLNQIKGLNEVRSAGSYLDWLCQVLTPADHFSENGLSTKPMWEREQMQIGKIIPTSFPQKTQVWDVFFHMTPVVSSDSHDEVKVKREELQIDDILRDILATKTDAVFSTDDRSDPLSPCPSFPHLPLKLGVTALCRAMEEKPGPAEEGDDEETLASKRVPLSANRPRLMNAVAQVPAFLAPKEESLGIRRGVATHRLLELLDLDGTRGALEAGRLDAYIKEETASLTSQGMLTAQEGTWIDLHAVAGFFRSSWGERLLKAKRIQREWSFTLAVDQPMKTLVQGVIDLCFAEDGQWVLLDFKTDRVHEPKELWERYARQLDFYRLALEKATGLPVKEIVLYSLFLGMGITDPGK